MALPSHRPEYLQVCHASKPGATFSGRLLLTVAFGVVFGIISIQNSLLQGQLSSPITYDDIVYLNDAAKRLLSFYSEGPYALFRDYYSEPPHSPVATGRAFLGFLLFGFVDWAAAAVNAALLIGLLIVLQRAFRGVPWWGFSGVALAVIAWPVTGFLLIEGRPDVLNGMLVAIGSLLVVSEPWLGSRPKRSALVGAIFGLALLTKPSVFPITLSLFGLGLGLASAIDAATARFRITLGELLRPNLFAVAVALLIAGPHYLLAFNRIWEYIVLATFGAERDLWAVSMRPLQHATYYLNGSGGQATMGPWLLVTLGLLLGAGIASILLRRCLPLLRIGAAGIIFLAAYATVSIPAQKSLLLGIVVTCMLLVAFVVAARYLMIILYSAGAGSAYQTLAVLLSLFLGFAATYTFRWHAQVSITPPDGHSRVLAAARHAMIDGIANAISVDEANRARIYLPTFSFYINSAVLDFALLKRGAPDAEVLDLHRSDDLAKHLQMLDTATHVLLVSENDRELQRWLPSNRVLKQVSAAVRANPLFTRIAAFPPAVGAGMIEVYRHVDMAARFEMTSGFLPWEGPYAQWNLPKVRWAVGKTAHLELLAEASTSGILRIKAQSPTPDHVVTVRFGDAVLGHCTFAVPGQASVCDVPFQNLSAGSRIAFDFAKPGGEVDSHRSLLFHSVFFLAQR